MSRDFGFRLNKRIAMHQLFDGRLERFGITETNPYQLGDDRYLTDGDNCVWVRGRHREIEGQDIVVVTALEDCAGNPEHILHAIQAAFNVKIFEEHDPQFWGWESFEELYAEYEARTKQNRDEWHDELIRFVRGAPSGISPRTVGETLAKIAKVVTKRHPELTLPGAKEALFNAMVAELKEASTHGVPEQFDSWESDPGRQANTVWFSVGGREWILGKL